MSKRKGMRYIDGSLARQVVWLVLWIVLFSGYTLPAQSADQNLEADIPWQLVEDESGIKVYLGPWPGSDFVAFKSETVFDVPMENMLAMINDIDGYKEWMPDCEQSEMLSEIDDTTFIYYVAINLPWPLEDRDWVNQLKITKNSPAGNTLVTYSAYPGFLPEKKGTIRITRHYALWVLTPLANNWVQSIWYGHSEPGGWIPPWFVKQTIADMILETTLNMRDQVKQEKYRSSSAGKGTTKNKQIK